MSSSLRLQWPGAVLHVTSRGDNKRFIFLDDEDFEYRVHLIGRAALEHEWSVHSYAVMGNHDHLSLELSNKNVSTGVQAMNGTYARYFNKKYERSGHVFEDRFRSVVVDAETHFLEVSAYIPLNPVRAKVVRRPEDYRWSSYRATAGLIQVPPWLNVSTTLSRFAVPDPCAAFRRFVESRVGRTSPFDDAVENVLGSDGFRAEVQRTISELSIPHSVPRRAREVVDRPGLDEIASIVCQVLDLHPNMIRAKNGRNARSLIALVAREEGALTTGDCRSYWSERC